MKRTFRSLLGIASLAVALSASAGGQEKAPTRKAGEATEEAGAKAGKGGDKGLDAAGKGVGAAVEHTGRGLAKVGKVLTGKDNDKDRNKSNPDAFDKAGNATEEAFDKAGDGLSTGIKATGKAMAAAGEAVGDVFTDDNDGNGDRRREAQRALEAKGYYRGPIDGKIGPKIRSGLREYQRDNALEVTGSLDAKTAKSLGVN